MLMKTQPKVELDPMKRPPLKFGLAMKVAAERAKDQTYIGALASRVDEFRMLWRG